MFDVDIFVLCNIIILFFINLKERVRNWIKYYVDDEVLFWCLIVVGC